MWLSSFSLQRLGRSWEKEGVGACGGKGDGHWPHATRQRIRQTRGAMPVVFHTTHVKRDEVGPVQQVRSVTSANHPQRHRRARENWDGAGSSGCGGPPEG